MDKLVKMTEIYKEVFKYKGWYEDNEKEGKYKRAVKEGNYKSDEKDIIIQYDSYMNLLQKKYRTLLKTVLFRDISFYKDQKCNYAKVSDRAIIREILIMSTSGNGRDANCVAWLNNSLKLTDYEKTASLYENLIAMLENLLHNTHEIEEVTYYKWKAAIDTTLHGETAKNARQVKQLVDKLFKNSIVLNNYNNTYELEYKDKDGNIRPFFPEPNYEGEIYIQDIYLSKLLIPKCYQVEYFEILNKIIEYLSDEVEHKSKCIIAILADKIKNYNFSKSSYTATEESMAYSNFGINYQICKFLEQNPDICHEIEKEVGLENLTSYFPYMDSEAIQ